MGKSRSSRRKRKSKSRTARSERGLAKEEFRFRRDDEVGTYDADDDLEMLRRCFVDTGRLAELSDIASIKGVIVGRTGSGKSALLHMLKERETLAKWLRPEDLALHHVANSNIIQFLESSGVNLDPFYKLLWRHVLCVELLKLALNAT